MILGGAIGTASAATVTIDNFAAPAFPGGQVVIRNTVGSTENSYTGGGPGLLGGQRLLRLDVSADAGSAARANVNSVLANRLVYENGADIESVLTLRYNANGAGLGQNWSALDELTFLVDFSDQSGTLLVEMFADSNYTGPSYAMKSTVIPELTLADSPFFVSFNSFATFGGFDFSDIDSIRISIEGTTAYDMIIHEIHVSDVFTDAVPEPAAVVPVFGFLAGAGFWVVRRRRAGGAATTATAS